MLVLLALSAALYFAVRGSSGGTAEIYREDILLERIDLSAAADGTFTVAGAEGVVFVVRSGAIGIAESSCPDKLCVKSGMISRGGQMCVCLPNRVVIKILGESDTDIII